LADVFSEIRLDPSSDLTIVGQIRAQVTLLIADGRIEPGSRLPAVRTMAELLEINVNTVRSAYARLEEDGLVVTRHGVGTIVQPLDAGTLKPGKLGNLLLLKANPAEDIRNLQSVELRVENGVMR